MTLFAAALLLTHLLFERLPVARFHPVCEDPSRGDTFFDYPDEFQVRGPLHPVYRAAIIDELIRQDEHIRVVGATGPIYVTGPLWTGSTKRAWITRLASYHLFEKEIEALPYDQGSRVMGELLANFDKACAVMHALATAGRLPPDFPLQAELPSLRR